MVLRYGKKSHCDRDQYGLRMRLTHPIETAAEAIFRVDHPVELQPGCRRQTLDALHCEVDVAIERITQHDDPRYAGQQFAHQLQPLSLELQAL